MASTQPPLVLHVLHRFATGGLENGVVNLIRHMPPERYRHAVLALTDIDPAFAARLQRSDVELLALHKPPGQTARVFGRLYRRMVQLRPAIVHSRNLAALEAQVPAWLAGVPVRIHGEHGLGLLRQGRLGLPYALQRRLYKPWVQHYIALSTALRSYLERQVGVAPGRISQICNGVDLQRFVPHPSGVQPIAGCPFDPQQHWLVGSLGRMQPAKDPMLLAHAFVLLLRQQPALQSRVRLVMVGQGPLREPVAALLQQAGLAALAWLPGERADTAALLQGLHAYVQPSRCEGIPNAVLEAMASALPVLATAVGGTPELVLHGHTGCLVEAGDASAMASQLLQWATAPAQAQALGQAGRAQAQARFGLETMVASYMHLYDDLLQRHGRARAAAPRSA